MTDADIVREALQRILCVDDHGFVYEGTDTAALAALDRLVAERDEALAKADRLTSRGIEDLRFSLEAAEAEVQRLREALEQALPFLRLPVTDADLVREFIGGCLALHGFREDCPACVAYRDANAALDRLVAERDAALRSREEMAVSMDATEATLRELRAEVARLREALMPFVDKTRNLTNFDLARAVAALGEDA